MSVLLTTSSLKRPQCTVFAQRMAELVFTYALDINPLTTLAEASNLFRSTFTRSAPSGRRTRWQMVYGMKLAM